MVRTKAAGLWLALTLIIYCSLVCPAEAEQLYLNELLESHPHIQVPKEDPIVRTLELNLEPPVPGLEPEALPAPAPLPQRKIALTFDDGPDRINTPKILDILRDEQVVATFFVLGEKVERYPEVTQRIFQEGHLLANHSRTHADFAELSNEEILFLELEPTSAAVERLTGYYPRIMRPPYGSLRQDSVVFLRESGWQIVRWSLDTFDWDSTRNSPEEIIERVKTQHHNKAVVLMHCNGPATIQALPGIIKVLRGLGYEFVPVNQL
ncbi:MAG TPA: polysaccharide deacetylase family protein [Limnochordia bacterium]|nr:polysaccharide deacetylase family protein [Limnochordia bacterium]HPP73313.1 polysaccharide deacetylase family protein [Limnochordia bacterium]HPT83799.1 polysaccharide deacetylase family protein [Limnochordia bacterium]